MARALEEIGEWWTLLVVREVFYGNTQFSQIQRVLGLAPNVLTDRLGSLVENDILSREAASDDRRRIVYRLTEKGQDLLIVLGALMQWGGRWVTERPTLKFIDTANGGRVEIAPVNCRSGRRVRRNQVAIEPGPGWGGSRPVPDAISKGRRK